jgi:glycosyltransferase involved in cell wall biosynthesis
MHDPLVSVLIPVYNAGPFLRPSLESVLRQSYTNLEIILIDDGSTDGCVDFVSDIGDARVRVLRQANQGKPVALNRALDNLHGDFYAIQDADDLSHPKRLERQVGCLLKHPEVAGVFTGHDVIINGRRMAPRFAGKGAEACRVDVEEMRMPGHDPTVMYRVSDVIGIRFEPSLPGCEGFDHLLRVGEQFPLMVLGECLYSYRINTNSVTRKQSNRINELVGKVQQRAAERRGRTRALRPYDTQSSRQHRSIEHGVVSHFIESVMDLKRAAQLGLAFETSLRCLSMHPLDPLYYKPLLFALSPIVAINRYRRWGARARD